MDRKAVAGFKTVTSSVEIPEEKITEPVNPIVAGSLSESLSRIARHFIIDKQNSEKELLDLAGKYPLQFLFSHHLVDAEGRTEATLGSIQDDLDGHVIAHMAELISMSHFLLRRILDEVRSRFVARGAYSGESEHPFRAK